MSVHTVACQHSMFLLYQNDSTNLKTFLLCVLYLLALSTEVERHTYTLILFRGDVYFLSLEMCFLLFELDVFVLLLQATKVAFTSLGVFFFYEFFFQCKLGLVVKTYTI